MRRDMDLIRGLLLKLEDFQGHPGTSWHIKGGDEEITVDGFDEYEIAHHLEMLVNSDLIRGKVSGDGIIFYGLSWVGRDFLDSVRDDDIWRRTKEGAKQAKGFTLGLLVDIAKAIIKGEVAKHTGLSLS